VVDLGNTIIATPTTRGAPYIWARDSSLENDCGHDAVRLLNNKINAPEIPNSAGFRDTCAHFQASSIEKRYRRSHVLDSGYLLLR